MNEVKIEECIEVKKFGEIDIVDWGVIVLLWNILVYNCKFVYWRLNVLILFWKCMCMNSWIWKNVC